MTKQTSVLSRSLTLLLLAGAASPTLAASGEDWDWMVAPYVWGAGVSTDLATTVPPTQSSSDTSFADVLDKLDGVFEVHAEGRGDHFGALVDFTYLGLADEKDHRFQRTETDLDARLLDAAITWSPGASRTSGFGLLAGVRYIDVDFAAEFLPYNPAIPAAGVDFNKSFTDFLLGARYTWELSDKWSLTVRGDGSTGDSEGTWSGDAMAQYRTKNGAWIFGYRYLDISVGAGNVSTDVAISGPIVGYGFRF